MKYYLDEARDDFYHPIGTLILEIDGKPIYRIVGYNYNSSHKYNVTPLSDGGNRTLGARISNIGDILYPKESKFDSLYLRLKS